MIAQQPQRRRNPLLDIIMAAAPEMGADTPYATPPIAPTQPEVDVPEPSFRERFPAMARREDMLANPPEFEKPSKGRRIMAAIVGALSGASGGAGQGAALGRDVLEAPRRDQMQEWETKARGVDAAAGAERNRFDVEQSTQRAKRETVSFEREGTEHALTVRMKKAQADIAEKQRTGYLTPEQAKNQRKVWVEENGKGLPETTKAAFILSGEIKMDTTTNVPELFLQAAGGDADKAREMYEDFQNSVAGRRGKPKPTGPTAAQKANLERWKSVEYKKLEAAASTDPRTKRPNTGGKLSPGWTPELLRKKKQAIEDSYAAQLSAFGGDVAGAYQYPDDAEPPEPAGPPEPGNGAPGAAAFEKGQQVMYKGKPHRIVGIGADGKLDLEPVDAPKVN
jgi:hypothetical protein